MKSDLIYKCIPYGSTAMGPFAFVVENEAGVQYPLKHFVLHSPTGMSFGYGGSGPADLALSILADALDEDPSSKELYNGQFKDGRQVRCLALHQGFKWGFVAKWPQAQPWEITHDEIMDWVAKKEAEGSSFGMVE